jgi:hypothetical protein
MPLKRVNTPVLSFYDKSTNKGNKKTENQKIHYNAYLLFYLL